VATPTKTATPTVLVQLPVYNEPKVISRIIDAVAQLDWPSMEIQVLDDSTDETCAIAASRVAHWSEQGVMISHIRRDHRTGYKAGALAHGLDLSPAKYIAIFDADFVPEPDFLRKMMPSLLEPNVGMVQACWGHLNRNQNWTTRVQAMILDGHFVIEHTARFRSGRFFNFNGTAGIWRRDCIIDAGGWSHDTVTEDLDLSYRAQMKGWNFIYRDDVVAPAELPGTTRAFLGQQHRWAKGTVQTSRKLLDPILLSNFPVRVRLEAANHLLMVWAYPTVFLLSILFPLSILARVQMDGASLLILDLFAVIATTVSIGFFYAVALQRSGERLRSRWWEIPLAMSVGIGCSGSQTLAVIEGAWSNDATFERTPKQGTSNPQTVVPPAHRARLLISSSMSAYYAMAMYWTISASHWESLPFMLLFATGYWLITFTQWTEGSRTAEAAEMGVAHAAK